MGFSFGGPYGRACAYAPPRRVTRAGLAFCPAPVDDPAAKRGMPAATRYGLAAARVSPLAARPMVRLTAHKARAGKMIDALAKVDVGAGRRGPAAGRSARRARREPGRVLPAGRWPRHVGRRGRRARRGLSLEDIDTPVVIWHGELDRNDPIEMARTQARRLPRIDAHYYRGEGHLIFFGRIAEILAELTAS